MPICTWKDWRTENGRPSSREQNHNLRMLGLHVQFIFDQTIQKRNKVTWNRIDLPIKSCYAP